MTLSARTHRRVVPRWMDAVIGDARGAQTSGAAARNSSSAAIFKFETDEFWLNLHHFLYVLGRAEAKEQDASREAVAGAPADAEKGLASLSDDERQAWRAAVTAYAGGLSKKDTMFDATLPALTTALARAGDAATLANRSRAGRRSRGSRRDRCRHARDARRASRPSTGACGGRRIAPRIRRGAPRRRRSSIATAARSSNS